MRKLQTLEYPVAAGLDKCTGILIYAKAVLAQSCPYWLLTYAAQKDSAVFPHDPTSDQWFNEAQFAAYTELGRIMAREVVQCQADLSADADRNDRPVGADTAAGGASPGAKLTSP